MRRKKAIDRCAPRHPVASSRRFLLALTATLLVSVAVATVARAQQVFESPAVESTPKLLYRTGAAMPRIYGISHSLAPGWKASYGLGLADETALSSAFLRLDELIESGELSARGAREKWRHFLGIEYTPMAGFDLVGGVAKSSGVNGKGGGLAPSGYERLRLNSGVRWRGDAWGLEGWGIDSSFAFIPNGPSRWPSDAGFLPGMGGGGGPTWLLSLTVSRQF